jgi:membrane protein
MIDATHSQTRREHPDRGRRAASPTGVPARGWKDVAVRVKDQFRYDDVPLLAAGVAFFALLALVPTLVALVSMYGLVADPSDIESNIEGVMSAAPVEVQELVSSQLSTIVDTEPTGLQLGAVAGLLVALWSASSGTKNLMGAINRAYDETDERGFVRLRGLALGLTVAAIVVASAAVAGLIVLPNALDSGGAEGTVRMILLIGRWPLFAVIALAALAVLYRWAPDRNDAQWRWVSPGALLATGVWLVASVGFSIYTANFGNYNETYGALGAVVVVMLWLFITAFVIIAGAELNAELERQTTVDTTTGEAQPLGEREAYAADTVGRTGDS